MSRDEGTSEKRRTERVAMESGRSLGPIVLRPLVEPLANAVLDAMMKARCRIQVAWVYIRVPLKLAIASSSKGQAWLRDLTRDV